MAYMSAMGECYACRGMFSFNPNLAPSIPIDA